ncbi:methyl-accepting chemotaxis protein [Acidisoma sp. C75]
MRFFKNMSLLAKFIVTFAILLIFAGGLGLFAVNRIGYISNVARGFEANIKGTAPIQAMARSGPQIAALAGALALTSDPQQAAQLQQAAKAEAARFAANWALYRPTMDPGRETNDGQGFSGSFAQMNADFAKVAQAVSSGDHAAAAALVTGPMAALRETFNRDIADDFAYQAQMANGHAAAVDGAESSSRRAFSAALVLMILLSGGLVWMLIRAIGSPISTMTETMRQLASGAMDTPVGYGDQRDEIGRMARAVQVFKDAGLEKLRLEGEIEAARIRTEEDRRRSDAQLKAAAQEQAAIVESLAEGLEKLSNGDLLFRLSEPFSPAYEKLRADFNNATARLHDTMAAISANTTGVDSAAAEISAAADDLSRRTEQQAAAIEEMVAALQEITTAVGKSASGAAEVRQVAGVAKQEVEKSGVVVQAAVGAVSVIADSSREIFNIIGVIDEIAFQTNLLALNAGVEAARAGESGRGFAVVATEVRALAQRSAEAAREIKRLISTSGAQVETGVKLVGETGDTLKVIADQVDQLNNLITGIADQITRQSSGLGEVNSAAIQMDKATQQNAAMVEETTAASHGLKSEASELARLVGQFQISDEAVGAPATPPIRTGARASAPRRVLAEV